LPWKAPSRSISGETLVVVVVVEVEVVVVVVVFVGCAKRGERR